MPDTTTAADTLPSRKKRNKGHKRLNVALRGADLLIKNREYQPRYNDGDISNFNKRFIQILDELRGVVEKHGLQLSIAQRDKYLSELRTAGRMAYNKLILPDARSFIAQQEAIAQRREQQLTLTFTTPPERSLFWEMLYAGNPGGPVDIEQFWGFRYPIGRTFWGADIPDEIDMQMGILSGIHHRLLCSQQEVSNLSEYISRIHQGLGSRLVMHLIDDLITLDELSCEHLFETFRSETFRYGILHFACHCVNTPELGASRTSLQLTAHEQELEFFLEELSAWKDFGFMYQPLVFLNACDSATSGHLLQTLSFPSGFLDFGAGGVIATAGIVPDNFASEFASEFYKRLLNTEHLRDGSQHMSDFFADIGNALLETRWYFLEQYNNPLGLAYGLYAESNQQLRLLG
jgi:hypothetical protein